MEDPGGDLHATAYMLSQSRFLDDLEFVFGRFRTYQVPIATIEETTGLDFGSLRDVDPMGAIEGVTYRPIERAEDLIV